MTNDRATGEIRIGASGWHYKHWVGNFYPRKQRRNACSTIISGFSTLLN